MKAFRNNPLTSTPAAVEAFLPLFQKPITSLPAQSSKRFRQLHPYPMPLRANILRSGRGLRMLQYYTQAAMECKHPHLHFFSLSVVTSLRRWRDSSYGSGWSTLLANILGYVCMIGWVHVSPPSVQIHPRGRTLLNQLPETTDARQTTASRISRGSYFKDWRKFESSPPYQVH